MLCNSEKNLDGGGQLISNQTKGQNKQIVPTESEKEIVDPSFFLRNSTMITSRSNKNSSSTKKFLLINENQDQELIQENENIHQESSKSLQFIYDDESSTDSLIEEKIKEFRLDQNENHLDEEIHEEEQISDRQESKQEGEHNSLMDWGSSSIKKQHFKQIEEEVTEEEAATEEEHDADEEECNFKCFTNYSNKGIIRQQITPREQNDLKSKVKMISVTEESANNSNQLISEKPKDLLGERTLSLSKLKASLAVFKSVDISCFPDQQDSSEAQLNGQSNTLKGNEENISLSEQHISRNELFFYQTNKLASICSRTIPQDLSGREVMFLRKKSQKPYEIQQIQSQSIENEVLSSDRSNLCGNNKNILKEGLHKECNIYKENEDPHTPCLRTKQAGSVSNDLGYFSNNTQQYQQSLTKNMSQKGKISVSNALICYSNGFKDNSSQKNNKKIQLQEEQGVQGKYKIPANVLAEDNYQQYLGFIHDGKVEGGILFSERENVIRETPGLNEGNMTQQLKSINGLHGGAADFTAIKRIPLNYCVENEETAFETVMDLKLHKQHSNTSSLSPKHRKGNNITGQPESKSTSAASCFLTSSKSNNNSQGTITNGHFGSTSNTGSIFLDNGFSSRTSTFLNNSRNLHHYHHPNFYLSSQNGNKTMNISSGLARNQGSLVVSIKRNTNLNSSNTSDQSRSASKGRGFQRNNSRNNSFTNSSHKTGKSNLLIVDHSNANSDFMNFHNKHTHSFDASSQKSQQKSRQLLYQRGIIPESISNSYSNSRNSISPSQIQSRNIRTRSQQKAQLRCPGNNNNIFANSKSIYENLRRQHSLSQDAHNTRSSADDKIFYKLNATTTNSNEYPAAETQPSIEPRTSLNDVFTRNLLTSSLNLNISSNMQNNSNNASNQSICKNSQTYNRHASFSNSHGHTHQRSVIPNQNVYAKMNGKFKRTAMIYLNSNSSLQKQHPQSYFKDEGIMTNNQSQLSSLQSTILQPSRTKVRVLLSAKQQPTANYINSRKYTGTPELDNIRNQPIMQTLPSALSLTLEQPKHLLSQGNRENYPNNDDYLKQFQEQKFQKTGNIFEQEIKINSNLQQQNCQEQQQPQFYFQNNSNNNNLHQQQPHHHHLSQQFPYNSLKPNKKQNIFSTRGGGGSTLSGQSRKHSSTIHNYLKNDQKQLDITMNSLKSTSAFKKQQNLSPNDSYLQLEDQQQINPQVSLNPFAKSKSQLRTSSELRDIPPPRRQGRSVQHKLMGNNDSFNNITHQNSSISNCKANFINNQFSQGKKHSTQISSSSYLKNNNNNSSDFLRFTSSVCERPFMKSPKQHKQQQKSNKRVSSQEDSRYLDRQAGH